MNAKHLGGLIKKRRKRLEMKQADFALDPGTGVGFISDLDNGKETCETGKVLKVYTHRS